ncbi:MAG: glycosyl hydrolase family 32 domain protein [Verrucomicrobia bacterium]|nr:MAG: glycosyl hydrolase family 32 domain protein [Verrucomicrobiota bacterium]
MAHKDRKNREVLDWKSWDVSDLKGKKAVLEIVDDYTGSWGHINVDQIVQSDTPRKPVFKPDYSSPVPKFTFAGTLAEQERQLVGNPLLERFRVSREKMKSDPHLPLYHFTAPENRLNDPNGLSFWKGKWHMFYQGYPPEYPRQHWGHAISDDLIHWRDLPYAIYPNPEQSCYSGSALVEDDRVIAMYHGTKVGSMVAVSDDPLLLNWEKLTGESVIPFPKAGKTLPYAIFDPFVWKKGDFYYALTAGWRNEGPGGKRVRKEWLHRSTDLVNWDYLHPFLEDDLYGLIGDDGACPYFWPIGSKHILLHFSHMTGAKYMLGDYDTERDKFVVTDGGDFNFGPYGPSGLHAPSATPDGKGGVIAIFNMNDGKRHEGWNGIMSLPWRLSLDEDDEIAPLRIEPAGDLESLRYGHQRVEGMDLPANEEIVFDNIKGNAMEIVAEIDCSSSQMLELTVLRSPNGEESTRILFFPNRGYPCREYTDKRSKNRYSIVSIDTSRSSILPDAKSRAPESAPVYLEKGETLKLHVFIDKSVVEVFVNGKQCVSVRVFPGREDSVGVSLRSQGKPATLKSLDAWQMKGIYE